SEDLKVWLWQALAAGGRFWNCNFTGTHPDATHDRRNAFNNIPAYRFVKENQAYLENQNPWAQIGIYYSKSTRLFYRSITEEGDTFEGSVKGIISVVNENHIPFDFLADDDLDIEKLSKYKLIILSNVRCMSERECEVIEAFVRNGGTLLATYASSLYTENGSMRDDFALAKLFGCSFSGEKWNTRKDHYQHIVDTVHPMVREFSDQTELLINAGYSLLTEMHPASKMICSLVPVVHNQPPEKAWSKGWSTRFPSIVENTYGKGKVLYFSNQPDQVTFEIGHPDMRVLLANAIRYLAPKAIPWKTNIPESVHIGLTESSVEPGSFIISVVNTSSAPARPLRNILPVYDLRIEVELPGKLTGYSVLYKNESVKVKKLRDGFAIRIRRLDDYNAVFFKLT
ncbi:MAG: beta-galactosidase trimerization domain-containing protein, partial [Cyclobacteriaceae bacterium]|nr:beta-galactosidase trimerization domain-containing protein [Cyclobacteriaceae bacterium]